ncbi:hypothetical protein SAMN02746041_01320 [Desulfacinum hydrothermale DSM 13146]|uniref:Cysteinyl-tRNA ligase anticodon binding domain-containing protein n=1 Tax=Desulfacinum hydrothermale DSM 13146 TaxID=1121390 RepID=A0A1W1XDL5_9BACT|nr:hypothetical protein [Desulfacinum hydrothermale]SMC21942.1 hypothetical protein SAMN02746041_01320 [Desulfacinum hydrothermale DSM 13146]
MTATIRSEPAPAKAKGILALMGSGELTATMVEVHKALLRRCGTRPLAVFLDTPAGFQLNVDEISRRAQDYFSQRVGYPLQVASIKSRDALETPEGRRALDLLQAADVILVGPGSPSYAVRHWVGTPVPEIFKNHLLKGGVLTAASAAALTLGLRTLPVYEIYKVGADLHWAPGLDVLGFLGIRAVVVPHWNNAEGGTHDTRFCYMGRERFQRLQAMLPDETAVLGIDEHTAVLLDWEAGRGTVKGLGKCTLRRPTGGLAPRRVERVFASDATFRLEVLCAGAEDDEAETCAAPETEKATGDQGDREFPESLGEVDFWSRVRQLESTFRESMAGRNSHGAAAALLGLDMLLWQAQEMGLAPEEIAQAREIFREWLVAVAQRLALSKEDKAGILAPVVDRLLEWRRERREEHDWGTADGIRNALAEGGVLVEDTPDGPRWRVR